MARVVQMARYQADGTQVTRTFEQMGQAGEKMSQRVKQGANSMSPALRGIDAAAGAAKGKVDGLATSTGSLGRVLTAMGPAGLAAAAAIGGIALAFNALQRAALEAMRTVATIDGVANQVGVTTDFVQEFRYAVTATGGDVSIADAALTSFTRNIGQLSTELGKRAKGALEELGFSEAEIRNMNSAEEALPRIIARISQLDNAAEQMAIAQKLGLESVVETLQAGEGAFDSLRQRAHEVGAVLDREMIVRAAEMEDAWKLARLEISANMNGALVELAPVFVKISTAIAEGTHQLVGFLRQMDLIEDRSVDAMTTRLSAAAYERQNLIARFGDDVRRGGDADRSSDSDPGSRLVHFSEQSARNRVAWLNQEIERLDAAIRARLARPTPRPNPRPDDPPTGNPSLDAQLAQMRQFVDQLNTETAARDRLNAIMGENAKFSREEAQAVAALQLDLQRLQDARAAGVITSDAELQRLSDLRRAREDETAAIRQQEEERRRLASVEAANNALRSQMESPRQRIAREIAALEKNRDLDPGLVAERVRQLREEYSELAAAQFEASYAGQALAGVMQGQIRDVGDLGRLLRDLVADAAIREMLAGGVFREGGVGGYFSRVGDRIAGGLTGDDSASMDSLFGNLRDMFSPLEDAAKSAGSVLADELASSAAEAGAKMALGTVEKLRETAATNTLNLSLGLATKSAQALAIAMQRAAAASEGKGASSFLSAALSAFGGGNPTAVPGPNFGPKGGGLALGGPMIAGYRHPFAETRPELSIVGGWGQVAPPAAVDGLAVLARLSKIAQSPASAPGAAQSSGLTVNVINRYGADVDVATQERMGPNGERMLDVVLEQKVGQKLASGDFDGNMNARYGAQRRRNQR
jgi:hypothetical protein